jgi:hypothetical protein
MTDSRSLVQLTELKHRYFCETYVQNIRGKSKVVVRMVIRARLRIACNIELFFDCQKLANNESCDAFLPTHAHASFIAI